MTIPDGGTVAPLSRRVVAYVIDALIAVGILIVAGSIVGVILFSLGMDGAVRLAPVAAVIVWLVMVGWLLVYTAMQGGPGSIGMRAQRLRLGRERDGERIGFGAALLRNLVFGITANFIIGYFTPLLDGSGRAQGWHDKVGRALMLEARPAPKETSIAVMSTIPPLPVPSRRAGASVPPAPVAPNAPVSAPAEETVIAAPRPPIAAPPASAASAAPPVPASPVPAEGLIAFVPGVTQDAPAVSPAPVSAAPAPASVAPVPAAPVPAPVVAPPASVPSAPESEEEDVEATRISVPGHRLVFTWDDGTRVEVSRRTLFGRNPAAEAGASVVPVRDETLSLSKTHFEAGAEASGGWVRDLHSTNGTTIVRGGERIACPPGEKVRVSLGDALEIGDRIVTIGGYT